MNGGAQGSSPFDTLRASGSMFQTNPLLKSRYYAGETC